MANQIGSAGYQENRGCTTVSFSATPTFDGSLATTFMMTLTGNVTSSTFINGVDCQRYTFLIKQDGAGLHSFAWPSNFKGVLTIPVTSLASTTAAQMVHYDAASGNCYALAVGLLNL